MIEEGTTTEKVAKRVVKNCHWASIYLACFDGSNSFNRQHNGQLDSAAAEILYVLDRGMPRLVAICLCRIWDPPGRDRHSLLALIGRADFVAKAQERDPGFICDCKTLSECDLVENLRKFRNNDLAHNLPLGGERGITYDELREAHARTLPILDRVAIILEMDELGQDINFQFRKDTCEEFWQTISSAILIPAS